MHNTARQESLKRQDRTGYGASEPPVSNVTAAANEDSPLLLNIAEVAKLLQVSVRTVNRLDSGGWMPKAIRILGCKRFRRNEIVAWIAAGCPKPE
jgi:predicted DNA-binding transcriptional regulator AlpA